MNKTTKRIFTIILILVLLCASVWGGLILIRNAQKEPVKVYAVTDFSTGDDSVGTSQTYGMVTADQMQKIMLTESESVKKIFVKKGQKVKKGDPLLSCDTTLSDIDLKKAELEVNRLKLQQKAAENELKRLKKLKPHSRVLITPPQKEIIYEPQETPLLLKGSGTQADPFYYLWGSEDSFDTETLKQLLPPNQEAYLVLVERENNALNSPVVNSLGLHLKKGKDSAENIQIGFFQATLPDDMMEYEINPEPYYEESGSDYTKAELTKMKLEKEQEIKDLEISIRIAKVDLKQKKKETSDGTIRSTIDGVVKTLRKPDEAFKNNEPVLEVSAGGGYYINAALSELELDTVQKGQTVQISSWSTGTFCEGKIVEISTYPSADGFSYSSGGNTNVSYYPFRIFVDGSANLTENDYVNISYQSQTPSEGGSSLFLENSFIRTENGKSYVYVRNEQGLLEQRTIQTGRDLYGSYTEIRSGLTMEDYIAFPYGKDVTNGAETIESTPDSLYES